ncbi:hypothetical protein MK079_01510 [Candidatus Gracilibacteria bacterium]|nr:hypothetical protein [Candidatus Gracilibacteria bacterium]
MSFTIHADQLTVHVNEKSKDWQENGYLHVYQDCQKKLDTKYPGQNKVVQDVSMGELITHIREIMDDRYPKIDRDSVLRMQVDFTNALRKKNGC